MKMSLNYVWLEKNCGFIEEGRTRKGPHLTLGSSGLGNLTRADPSHSSIVSPRHATENRDIPVAALSFCNAQKVFIMFFFIMSVFSLIFKETLLLAHLFTLHPHPLILEGDGFPRDVFTAG